MDVKAKLEEGIEARDLRRVRGALRQGADPNAALGADQRSALCCAAGTGDIRLVAALVEAGAKVAANQAGTALHAAVACGDMEMLEILLKAGGRRQINRFDADERTPLMLAVKKGNVAMARQLLEAGADVNARQDESFADTSLRIAAAEGTLEMVKLLMEAGADPLIPGRMLLTPFDRAKERDTPEGRMIAVFMERSMAAAKAAQNAPKRVKRAKAGRGRKR